MNWDKLLSTKRIRKSSKVASNDIRNNYESDLGRIIYSPALRRMHDKTQVFPLTTDDNIHTRLTHSNEVMSLGYTFGLKCATSPIIQKKTNKSEQELLRIIPIILQGISFIHDIGNPPFGHFAEEVISNYFDNISDNPFIPDHVKTIFHGLTHHEQNDFKFFDGNAQGLRVITKLQYLDDVFGMNLTYSILGSYLKYPNSYTEEIDKSDEEAKKELKRIKKSNIGKGKHGVFYSEKAYFEKIVDECGIKTEAGEIIRHPLCFLMEAADTIAYRVMDIEDGFSKGYVTIAYIKEAFIDNKSTVAQEILKTCSNVEINDEAKMILIRITLIDYLVTLAFDNFKENIEKIEVGQYNNELVQDDPFNIDKILERICTEKIFSTREINHLETTGQSVITGILNHYINNLFNKNKKFVSRSLRLISTSTINVAFEENMESFIREKYSKSNKADSNLEKNIGLYLKLVEEEKKKSEIDYKPIKDLRQKIFEGFKNIGNPIDFEDLSSYSKFRVIVDFISGMTDQYALSHFQKISGQRIG